MPVVKITKKVKPGREGYNKQEDKASEEQLTLIQQNNQLFDVMDNMVIRVYVDNVEQNLWRPPVRESSIIVEYNGYIYLYGGIQVEMFQEMSVYDLKKNEWKNIK